MPSGCKLIQAFIVLGVTRIRLLLKKKKIDQKNLGFAAALIFVTLIFWREMQLSKKANSRKSFSS